MTQDRPLIIHGDSTQLHISPAYIFSLHRISSSNFQPFLPMSTKLQALNVSKDIPRRAGDPIYTLEPTAPHTHTILLLHGLGSTGQTFGTELLSTGLTKSGYSLTTLFPYARFVFPTSKPRRSSAFARSVLTQWFDITRLQEPSYAQERQLKGLEESAGEILEVLKNELRRLESPRNLILGGLS